MEMAIRVKVFMKLAFKPKISFLELEYYLDRFQEKLIENNQICGMAQKLADLAFPTYQDKFDKRWNFSICLQKEAEKLQLCRSTSYYQ